LNGDLGFQRALADIVLEHLHSGQISSTQYGLRCPGCTNPACREILTPIPVYKKGGKMNTLRPPGKFIEVEAGVELYYEEKGEGQPLIFIPGWTFTTELFSHQLEYFSKGYRAIVIDPRSQGRSSKPLHGNDYATHGADLARLVRALDLKDIVLVGWSFGCLQSWAYDVLGASLEVQQNIAGFLIYPIEQ
jgi:hypothetical protein